MPWLHIVRGPGSGTWVALDREEIVIGRSPECGLHMLITAMGRQHARLRRVAGQMILEDLKSRGGTWVNGQQIHGPTVLCQGDQVCICGFEAVFEIERSD